MKKAFLLLTLLMICIALFACGQEETEVIAYVESSLTAAQQQALAAKIQTLPEVQSVTFVSPEAALSDFLAHSENPSDFAGIEASDLRGRFYITLLTDDLEASVRQLSDIPGIEKVNSPVEPGFWQRFLFQN